MLADMPPETEREREVIAVMEAAAAAVLLAHGE
jgi:hypothetical protein